MDKINDSHLEKTRSGNDAVRVSTWVAGWLSDIRRRGSERINQSRQLPEADERVTELDGASSCETDEETFQLDDEPEAKSVDETRERDNEPTAESSRFQRIKNAGEVLGRLTQSGESSVGNFTSLGRRKISELYQKLSVNRIKYGEVKEKRMEAKRILQEVKDDVGVTPEDIAIEEKEENEVKPTLSEEDNFLKCPTVSELSESAGRSLTGKRMGIGDIGRSSSANPSVKRKVLSEIGRCYSELNDEGEGPNLLVDERNNSYPGSTAYSHNTSSLTIKSDPGGVNNPKSLPASPTPRLARKGVPEETVRQHPTLLHDMSIQSDSSRCSSVESLLEARKPDAETILINLGFGPVQSEDILSRIPKRFLKPSQVRGIDTDAFLKHQQLANHLHEHSVLGYRGLVGNPHTPPSLIVAKIMERFQVNERQRIRADSTGNH
ncbi:hypothetical protein DMENIID0001_099780 [Sergentomyia squamirostris]